MISSIARFYLEKLDLEAILSTVFSKIRFQNQTNALQTQNYAVHIYKSTAIRHRI